MDLFSIVGGQLILFGVILVIIGSVLVILGLISATRQEILYQNKRISLDPNKIVSINPDGTPNHLLYLNLMLPLIYDSHISGTIIPHEGSLKFRILGYFGFPAFLGHGTWGSNIWFPKDPDREFEEVTQKYNIPNIDLLKRDYVCEFRVMDNDNPQPFKAYFTLTAEIKTARFSWSEDAKDFGRLVFAAGMPLIAVGIAALLVT